MLRINYKDPRPIYEQVRDSLRQLILSGAIAPGEKLPSVRELAGSLAINPNTIQRSYRELEHMGIIYTVAGKGAFAAEDGVAKAQRRQELQGQMLALAQELKFLGVTQEDAMLPIHQAYRGETPK